MKRFIKKFAATMLAVAVASATLTACSSGGQESSSAAQETTAGQGTETTSETSADAENITLRFSWWGGDSRHQALLSVIEAYESKYPNVTIEAEYQGYDGYYEKIMTTLSSNTAPDIMALSKEWLPDIQGAKHYLADLSSLPVDLSTLKDTLLEIAGTYNGEPLLFPCTMGGEGIIYVNTEFAETYGIDLSKNYTWNELIEMGSAIHELDPEVYLVTADSDMLNRIIMLDYLRQKTGTPLINEDDYSPYFTEEDAAEAFQNVLDMYESHTLEPFGDAVAFTGSEDQNIKWINGQIGMIFDYTGSANKYIASLDCPLDVIAVPRTEDAKGSGVPLSGDRGFAINDNSAHKEEAAKFLDFLMNDPEAIELCGTDVGYCPTKQSDDILIGLGLVSEVQKKAVEIASIDSFTNNMISGNTDLEVIRKDLIEEVVYGDITPEEAAHSLMEQYEEVLSELAG